MSNFESRDPKKEEKYSKMPGTSHPEKFARNSTSSDKLLSANEIGQFSPSSTARNNFHMEGKRGEGEEEEEKSSVGG